MNAQEIKEVCEELLGEDSKALFADGLEEAIIGVAYRFGKEPVICYDIDKCHTILEKQGMNEEEAIEYFEFNTLGAYVGEGTPVYIKVVR